MSKTGDWLIEMQERAEVMTREAFTKEYGESNINIWEEVKRYQVKSNIEYWRS